MSVADFAYLNAWVRAISTELLPNSFYEQVLSTEGMEPIIDALLASAYGPLLRSELVEHSGSSALEEAARRHIVATFRRVRAFSPEEPRRLLDIQFRYWDVANILAIVRGKVGHADASEIMRAVLPVGGLAESQLAALAAEPGLQELANSLTTWDYPFALDLRRAILRGGRQDLASLEAAAHRGFFRWALGQLRPRDPNDEVAREMLRLQIDLANTRMALDHVRHRERGEEVEGYHLLDGGRLGPSFLNQLASSATLLDAFILLEGTPFGPAIERGVRARGGAGNPVVAQRSLEGMVIRAGCSLFREDPLSVAVPLGFLWRKHNETVNLRILARGRAYRVPAETIREELVVA